MTTSHRAGPKHELSLQELVEQHAELLAALQDLTLNVKEAMKTGGWVPTPLQASFWESMSDALSAIARATT